MSFIKEIISEFREYINEKHGTIRPPRPEAIEEPLDVGPNEDPVIQPMVVDNAIEATAHTNGGELLAQAERQRAVATAHGLTFGNDTTTDFNFASMGGTSTFNLAVTAPSAFDIGGQLRIQEDGKIIVSTELRKSMTELAEEFWKEVTKKFPVSSNGQDRIDHMKEGIAAAMDVCEICDNGTCVACEILKTAMDERIEPEIEERKEESVVIEGAHASGIVVVGHEDYGVVEADVNQGVTTIKENNNE